MASLTFKDRQFFLKGEPFRIFSAAIHYFRFMPEHWQDRLLKAKACGLNTIETYLAWNLQEPKPGVFKNDGMLDFRRFIKMAGELGLLVILRPGPYICSEWDFGGMPSWLLADPDMKVRSNYPGYTQPAERFLTWVLSQVVDLQHSSGGPIIAVQVENEFGSYSKSPEHLTFIKDVFTRHGVTELLVTSDSESDARHAPYIDGVLPTANFQEADKGRVVFDTILKTNPEYPLMVMEFWTGWFDNWAGKHERRSVELLENTLKFCFDNNASVNFYMFFGGTNFGFMAGAFHVSSYKPDITSYDYDAPLSEDGSVTDKYLKIKDMIREEKHKLGMSNDDNEATTIPPNFRNRITQRRVIYLQQTMSWADMTSLVKKTTSSKDPKYMEMYEYPNGELQSYGYVIYRKCVDIKDKGKEPSAESELELPFVRDHANILVDGRTVTTFDWKDEKPSVGLGSNLTESKDGDGRSQDQNILDIVVENLGRVNFTDHDSPDILNTQRKGINGQVTLGNQPLQDWQVIALDFNEEFLNDVTNSTLWKPYSNNDDVSKANDQSSGPAIYRGNFDMESDSIGKDCDGVAVVLDSFVRLDGLVKGVVIVNGFNLGRYWDRGPQRTLYLPGPLLKRGANQVMVFEECRVGSAHISLEVEPVLG